VRDGSFRPMVFMSHGIVLARFLLVALMAAALILRTRLAHPLGILVAVWLGLVLVACKSMGALLLALAFLPIVLFTSARVQVRTAVVLAAIVVLYPVLRGADVFPTDTLVRWAEQVQPERAVSLGSRFAQEDVLLERARERLLFGWGSYGRSHVYDDDGKDLSVSDGEWIIVFGSRGLVGFLAWYALYLVPIFAARKHLARIRMPHHRMLVAGFALITAVMAVDTLPNAAGSLPHFFWSGALCGAVYGIMRHDRLLRLQQAQAQRRRKQARAREREWPWPVGVPGHAAAREARVQQPHGPR
jgi:O-antigen ligase